MTPTRSGVVPYLLLLLLASASCARTPKYDRPPRPPLTEAEAAEIVRSNGMLCQAAVGFHLDDPGPELNPRPDLEDSGGNVRMWVWENSRTGERVVINAIKAIGELPEGFQEWAQGNRTGVAGQAQIEEESISTETRPYTATLNARLKNGNAYSSRCLGTGDTGEMPWIVCVTTVSSDHAALKDLRESFALGSCTDGPRSK